MQFAASSAPGATCTLALLALLLTGCAATTDGPPQLPAPVATRVADGVYMLPGFPGEVDAGTLGRVGNAGFIVGDAGVIAIDTGTSYRHGKALLQAIAAVTPKPVRLALVTHARQEFLFGAAAYIELGIPIYMQRKTAQLMAARCEGCLKTLRRELGEDAMRGTVMFKPDVLFDEPPLLRTIGRPVQVLQFGHSSGPGDIAVLDVQTGVLFAGGLLDHRRVPEIQDAELQGWKQALEALRELPLTGIVPGHGPFAPPASIDASLRYLEQLEGRVLALLRDGAALSDVPDAASLPDFKAWDQYDIVHRRNASVLFVKTEHRQMFK